MLRQLEVEFAPLARGKGLDLVFVSSSLAVRSDRRLLRRLLQNLVSNAIKYTPQGTGVDRLPAQRFAACASMSSTLASAFRSPSNAKIFLEFHRLDQGARVARGLGLGLRSSSASRACSSITRHPSKPGRGSRFSVEIPLAPAIAATPHAAQPIRRGVRSLAGLPILCIDNEPQILDGMEVLLGGWGCNVSATANLERRDRSYRAKAREPARHSGRLSPRWRQRHRCRARVARRVTATCRPS